MNGFARFFAHFSTITRHRLLVMRYCFRAGIGLRGMLHDLSKYSPAEFSAGVRYYQGDRSPNAKEREVLGYSAAWMHHKGRNRHHFEYWNDIDPNTKQYGPVEMPIRFVKEMFCDRVAAGRIYRGAAYTDAYPLTYFRAGNARSQMHPRTAAILEQWLVMLAEQGEDATLAYLKTVPNGNKKETVG